MTLPHKTTIPTILLGLILLSGVSAGYAEEFRNTLSLQGVTGLLNTPNAEVADEGTASLLFSNQIESQWRDRVKREESYIFTIGIFSFAEIGGRLTEAPGKMRDLSANFKVRIPLIPRDAYFPQIAFGMQDLGGGGVKQGVPPADEICRRNRGAGALSPQPRVRHRSRPDGRGVRRR